MRDDSDCGVGVGNGGDGGGGGGDSGVGVGDRDGGEHENDDDNDDGLEADEVGHCLLALRRHLKTYFTNWFKYKITNKEQVLVY